MHASGLPGLDAVERQAADRPITERKIVQPGFWPSGICSSHRPVPGCRLRLNVAPTCPTEVGEPIATTAAEKPDAADGSEPAAGAPDVRLDDVASATAMSSRWIRVDLEIEHGEFFTMLGPSGSGKTTTLRMIAGFEEPDTGTVELGGRDVSGLAPVRPRGQHCVPGLRPVPAHDRRRERRLRDEGRARSARRSAASGPPRHSRWCRLTGLRSAARASSPAASASEWRWRARSSTARACCSWTSRSGRSTLSCASRCRSS